jgi:outer membrane protein TolC
MLGMGLRARVATTKAGGDARHRATCATFATGKRSSLPGWQYYDGRPWMARWRTISLLVIAAVFAATGCRSTRQVRDAEYAGVIHAVNQSLGDPQPALAGVPPIELDWEGPQLLQRLVPLALAQNPDVQAARKRMEAAAHQVPVAASLPDPMLGVTAFPEQVQTAAGQQEVSVNLSQKFPGWRKLETSAGIAESHTNVARAELASVELATIQQVKHAYYELYFLQQAVRVTEAEEAELVKIRAAASARYRATLTSQQDLLRADLELAGIANELIRLRQQQASAQARLARILHLSPRTRILAVEQLEREAVPEDLDWLLQEAVTARPELHAQLASLERDRRSAQLARLNYVPDVTLGMTWIDVASAGISPVANGRDAVLLTAGINVPIYRQRIDSSVKSAEAKAVATARGYDGLRDATLERVVDLVAQAQSQQDLIQLFEREILPKARQTYEVSRGAYSVGEVDFLQLIDNFRQLLRYEISHRRLEATLRQTLAELERMVGGVLTPRHQWIITPGESASEEELPPTAGDVSLEEKL